MLTKASTVITAFAAPLSLWIAAQGSPAPAPVPADLAAVAPELIAQSSAELEASDYLSGEISSSELSVDGGSGQLVWQVSDGDSVAKLDAKTGELVELGW